MRSILALIVAAFLPAGLSAQVHVGVQFNLGMQPAWAPVVHSHVEYYYIPAMEVYYHVPTRRYYFHDGVHWVHRSHVPHRYRHVDLHRVHKVVINEAHPWHRHPHYRTRYASYRDDHPRQGYREHRDRRHIEQRVHAGKGGGGKHKQGMKPGKGKGNRGRGNAR